MNITMEMLIDAYAEMNHLTTAQVKDEIKHGWIDGKRNFRLFKENHKYI